jgi:hypothetical protein
LENIATLSFGLPTVPESALTRNVKPPVAVNVSCRDSTPAAPISSSSATVVVDVALLLTAATMPVAVFD